jgi:hypothetical protein
MDRSAGRRDGHRLAMLAQAAEGSPLQVPQLAVAPIDESTAAAQEFASRCVVTTSDRAGRLADRSLVRYMGWARHTSVRFDVRGDVIVVFPATSSTSSITTQGHLRLPLAVRRRSRIDAGSRILVVAWPERGTLAMCTPDAVEEMILGRMLGTGRFRGGLS